MVQIMIIMLPKWVTWTKSTRVKTRTCRQDILATKEQFQNGAQAIRVACCFGHLEFAKALSKHGVSMSDSSECLFEMARFGHTQLIVFLLEMGADLTFSDHPDYNPLIVACMFGHASYADSLIKMGFNDVSAQNKRGDKALLLAL
jgi:hypothetical protein